MIEARELRVGNLVECRKTWNQDIRKYTDYPVQIEVEGITKEGVNPSGNYDCSFEYDSELNDIYGIPLTKEWLFKFGFVEFMYIDGIYGFNFGKFGFVNDGQIRIEDGFGEYDSILLIKEIKYIHQLQNIYFTLTGEELIVN